MTHYDRSSHFLCAGAISRNWMAVLGVSVGRVSETNRGEIRPRSEEEEMSKKRTRHEIQSCCSVRCKARALQPGLLAEPPRKVAIAEVK